MYTGGDEAFCAEAAGLLAALPGVRAVALGGSRAWGTASQDSDWDFAVYYRGAGFDPASSVSAAASATKTPLARRAIEHLPALVTPLHHPGP